MARACWPKRSLVPSSRGGRYDSNWHLRFRPHRVRAWPEPTDPPRVPCSSLRRLVGRGSSFAWLQHIPTRRLRYEAAVPRWQRSPLETDNRVPLLRGDRVQRRPGRAGARLSDLPACRDWRADKWLCQPPAEPVGANASLAEPRSRSADLDHGLNQTWGVLRFRYGETSGSRVRRCRSYRRGPRTTGTERGCLICREPDGGFMSEEHSMPESLGNRDIILPNGGSSWRC
jgi:hypothetical protein